MFTYSLKEGINDGFITPFRVKQIQTTLHEYVYTPDDVVTADQNAHPCPDLLHVQQVLSRDTTLSLRQYTRRVGQAVVDLGMLAEQATAERDACSAECLGSLVVAELAGKADQALQGVADAKTLADYCRRREECERQARRGLRDDDHPFDLNTVAIRDHVSPQRISLHITQHGQTELMVDKPPRDVLDVRGIPGLSSRSKPV